MFGHNGGMALTPGFHPRFDLWVERTCPGGAAASRWIALLRDDKAQDAFEYALALALFAMVALVAIRVIPQVAISQVTTDDTNFSQSLANGY